MRILLVLLTIVLVSCKDEEETYPFDQSPYVEFEELVFYDNQQGVDTLALSFIVWDREGDVGIEGSEINPPYHYFDLIVDQNNVPVSISGNYSLPFYSMPMTIGFNPNVGDYSYFIFPDEKVIFSEIDSRPSFSCDSYLINLELDDYDTLYGSFNQNRNNLHIGFLRPDGSEFNFQEAFNTEQCGLGNFDARVSPLEEIGFFSSKNHGDFSIKKRDKYSYEITYYMRGSGLKFAFQDNQFEIEFQVLDRELNKSNFGSSGLFNLQEITD